MLQIYSSDKGLSRRVYLSFCDWFQQAWMRLRGWWVGVSQSPSIAQIALSQTIQFLLTLEEADCCCDSKSVCVLIKQTFKLFILPQALLYFCQCYFVSFWGQTGVLHWQLILMIVAGLWVPINHQHEMLLYLVMPSANRTAFWTDHHAITM